MHSELLRKDLLYVWHPYTNAATAPAPVPVIKGRGSLLYDENGKSYIDAISSWWVNLHGHGHPYIAEKIYQQALELEQVIFAGFTHTPAVNLAERLIQILPGGMEKIFYSDNGSTAVEVALKMAIQYWRNRRESWELPGTGYEARREQPDKTKVKKATNPRHKILALKNSYHGDTFGAMSISERGMFTLAFQDYLFEVIFLDTPDEENINDSIRLIEESGEEMACFIYEPLVQGAGGMKMYKPELLDRLLSAVKKKDIMCIADEVMTGFYRTGKLFASEYMSVKPDIICLSKGLTGGTMALGVTACSGKIYDAFQGTDRLKTFFHGHSFTANPLACTAALASLDLLLEEDCINRINRICLSHCEFIDQLKTSTAFNDGKISDPRQCGTILAFEIQTTTADYLNPVGYIITEKSLEQGIFLRPLGNVVYVLPPYCITGEELKKVYDFISEFIQQ